MRDVIRQDLLLLRMSPAEANLRGVLRNNVNRTEGDLITDKAAKRYKRDAYITYCRGASSI